MPQPFAALEAKANVSVFKHMANAAASFTPAGGGDAVLADVVFDAAMGLVDDNGVVVTRPAITMPVALVPGLTQGYGVVIGGNSYLVRSVVQRAEGSHLVAELARA